MLASLAERGAISVRREGRSNRYAPLLSREDGFAETAPWSANLFASEEAAEGMASFREKRKPNWVKEDGAA